MKRDAAQQTCCVLEFEAKINAYFSVIKQRKWNSNIFFKLILILIKFWGGTLDIPLALPLVLAYLRCLGLRMNFKSVSQQGRRPFFCGTMQFIHDACTQPVPCSCRFLLLRTALCSWQHNPSNSAGPAPYEANILALAPFSRSKGFAQLLLYPSFVDTTPVLSKGVTAALLRGHGPQWQASLWTLGEPSSHMANKLICWAATWPDGQLARWSLFKSVGFH